MYPVRLGYDKAVARINKLMENGHYPEALVTSVFTVEKTLSRTLRQIIVSAGFASKQADKLIGNIKGFDAIKNSWEVYEPSNQKLTDLILSEDWKQFKDAATMRNKMIHGERVYELETCRKETVKVLSALERLKLNFDEIYGYSGWSTFVKRLKPQLHTDPKAKVGSSY